jgi:L-cysteine/cystine lyase
MATIIAKLEAGITARTRLLVISHVTWNTGLRLDLAAICAMAHKHGVWVVADAAQSVGMIPLDLPASGVDFYAMPAQKWLCGPEGIGALYVRADRLSQLNMTFAGFRSLIEPNAYDLTGHYMPHPNAQRFEMGTVNKVMVHAMAANFEWLEKEVGWDYIYNRIETLTRYAYERLSTLGHVTFYTQENAGSGLITFNLDGYEPPRVMVALNQAGVVLRYLGLPHALRIAVGFYNTEAEIDTLITELKKVQMIAPDDLPEYSSPFAK